VALKRGGVRWWRGLRVYRQASRARRNRRSSARCASYGGDESDCEGPHDRGEWTRDCGQERLTPGPSRQREENGSRRGPHTGDCARVDNWPSGPAQSAPWRVGPRGNGPKQGDLAQLVHSLSFFIFYLWISDLNSFLNLKIENLNSILCWGFHTVIEHIKNY
jgi:hypothetical protein